MSVKVSSSEELAVLMLGLFNLNFFTFFKCIIRYQAKWYSLLPSAVLYEISRQNALFLFSSIWSTSTALELFIAFFIFRYTRLLVNIVGFWLYSPKVPQLSPTFTANDVTVIVPTVDPLGADFQECIQSIYNTGPALIIIVAAGMSPIGHQTNFETLNRDWTGCPGIKLMNCKAMNKRKQICTALPKVSTPITIFADDHVFWPRTLLPHILAPFSDPRIGLVGTSKRTRRTPTPYLLNTLTSLYLSRQNFDHRSTYALSNTVSSISGRTSAHRTQILQSDSFLHSFQNQYTFFGLVGPLNADDDKFVTRWNVKRGWGIGYQDCEEEGRVECTVCDGEGDWGVWVKKNVRWMRTRWRGNVATLFVERTICWRQLWCVYAVYLTSFVNFALFYDGTLVYTLHLALQQNNVPSANARSYMSVLVLWILASKLVKTAPHFWRHPRDLVYLPGCILFGWFHSFIKLYALFTFWDVGWCSRELDGKGGVSERLGGDERV